VVLQIAQLADCVPVRGMRHLVRQERRELRLVLHARQHAGVHVDAAVWQRERV
jgi:hypothetical protein